MSLNVTALNDFNNELAGELLIKSVYAGSTMEYITIQEGVKYLEPINLFEVSLYMQNGACVSTASGSATFTQRNIQVCPRTSFDQLCLKELDPKYLGISSLTPGSYNETWTLSKAYSDLLVNQFQKANDLFLWQQESGVPSTYGGTCDVDGLKYVISGSTAGVVAPAAANVAFSSANALTVMDAMIEGLSQDVVDREDLTFFMSISNFKKFTTALRTLNNFFFDPSSITNKVLVNFHINAGTSNTTGAIRIYRNSTPIAIGDAVTTHQWTVNVYNGGDDSNSTPGWSMSILDTPSTTSPVTYQI
jgi:hypothetical protein